MTAIPRKQNAPGYIDEQGRFRPIRSPQFIGSGASKRKATVRDKKKYSRAKAGDLGKARQERALEAPWDREYRLEQEAAEADAKERARIEKEIEADVYGETSGRMSSGKAQSLAQFVRGQGGINAGSRTKRGRKVYGDLENFTRKDSGTTGLVTTVKGKGKGLDTMWQLARQSGFDLVSSDDLLDRLDDEIRSGKMTYATHGSLTYNPAAKKKTAKLKTASRINISEILPSNGEQTIAAARKRIKGGFLPKLPNRPINVVKSAGGKYIITDGFHRTALAIDKKRKTILAHISKANPLDLIGTFANLAVGISSAMHIDEAMKRRTRRPAAKRRGTTKAKTTARRNPARMSTVKAKGGNLYVLTIQRGDDEVGIYLHDGNANGFSKEVKTLAAARAYAKRTGRKLVENPAEHVKYRTKAAKIRDLKKLGYDPKKFEIVKDGRRWVIREKKKTNPPAARGKKVAARSKANPKKKMTKAAAKAAAVAAGVNFDGNFHSLGWSEGNLLADLAKASGYRKPSSGSGPLGRHFFYHLQKVKTNPRPSAKTLRAARKNPAKAKARKPKVNAARVPARRTFEMFQGRPATTARRLAVSRHAPARLDQLGDLIEVKLNSGKVLDFSKRNFKLCAAGGKLWIAGGKIAKLNPAAAANEINPIDSIDHVVYGTRKPHHGDHEYTHYIHRLGEESGHMPTLCVDREGFPIIRGGKYKIEARGIVN